MSSENPLFPQPELRERLTTNDLRVLKSVHPRMDYWTLTNGDAELIDHQMRRVARAGIPIDDRGEDRFRRELVHASHVIIDRIDEPGFQELLAQWRPTLISMTLCGEGDHQIAFDLAAIDTPHHVVPLTREQILQR